MNLKKIAAFFAAVTVCFSAVGVYAFETEKEIQTDIISEQVSFLSVENEETDYSALFNGGQGTAEAPYLIANETQLKNIGLLSDKMKAKNEYHFKLTTDITATIDFVITQYLYGSIDGDYHTLTLHEKEGNTKYISALIAECQQVKSVIKNITIEADMSKPIMYGSPLTYDASFNPTGYAGNGTGAIEFENVNLGSEDYRPTFLTGSNNGGFLVYLDPVVYSDGTPYTKAKFTNCKSYINYVSSGAQCYMSPFIGYKLYGCSSAEFYDCANYGDILISNAGLLIGNNLDSVKLPSDVQKDVVIGENFIVEDFKNYGKVYGTITARPVAMYEGDTSRLDIQNIDGGEFKVVYDNDLAINLTTDGYLAITQAESIDADSYTVAFTSWPAIYYTENGEEKSFGTQYTNVVVKIPADDVNGIYATDLKAYKMMDVDTYEEQYSVSTEGFEWKASEDQNIKYSIDDANSVIVLNFNDYLNQLFSGYESARAKVNAASSITVSALNADESLIGTKQYSASSEKYAASIGKRGYQSVEEAIKAADGQNVNILVKNYSGQLTDPVTIDGMTVSGNINIINGKISAPSTGVSKVTVPSGDGVYEAAFLQQKENVSGSVVFDIKLGEKSGKYTIDIPTVEAYTKFGLIITDIPDDIDIEAKIAE